MIYDGAANEKYAYWYVVDDVTAARSRWLSKERKLNILFSGQVSRVISTQQSSSPDTEDKTESRQMHKQAATEGG